MEKAIAHIRNRLKPQYTPEETETFILWIFDSLFGFSRKEILLIKDIDLPADSYQIIDTILDRLCKAEPIQYILGETEFCSLKLKVQPGVLIPRGETEELADRIIREHRGTAPDILDIGTGSGCIAIALKKFLPGATVWATDISETALEIAARNAAIHQVDIHFVLNNVLTDDNTLNKRFDILVSNPPYITLKEKIYMKNNVLDYEPHEALFVPDNEPLLFYKAILRRSRKWLKEKGWLYLEINEAFGPGVLDIFNQSGFEAAIGHDLHGKDRFVHAVRK